MAFSDARTNAPDPKVILHRDQTGEDQTAVNAVGAFGELGGQVRQGQVSGVLEAELARSGNIISTINSPKTITTENPDGSVEVDLTFSDPTGTIDTTSAEFQRVAAGIDQGKISEQRGAIEAEVILRKSIARAPGFASQLRTLAQETLGFNASGAALEALFLSGPDSNVITQNDKDVAEANARVKAGFHPTFQGAYKSVIGERARAGQLAEQNFRISLGELDAPRVAIAAGSAAQFSMNDIMIRGIQQIRNTGTVNDIEELRAGLMAAATLAIDETTGFMASNQENFYKPGAYDGVRAEVNRVRDANIEMLENQEVLNVFTRRQDLLQKVLFIEGVNIAPELALMSQFGEGAVEDYLELMSQSQGDPQLMEEFMRINPAFGFLGNIALNAKDIGPALRAISNGNLGQLVDNGNIDADTARGVLKFQALRQIESTADPEDFSKVITSLADLDLNQMVLSTAAQSRNSFAKSDDAAKAAITRQFKGGEQFITAQASTILANSPFELTYDANEAKFVVRPRPDATNAELERERPFNPSQFAGFAPAAVDASIAGEQLAILNDMMLPLMEQPQWTQHMGADSTAGWIADTLIAVNQGITQQEASTSPLGAVDSGEFQSREQFLATTPGELIRDTESGAITRVNEQGQQEQVFDGNFNLINADVVGSGPSIPAGSEGLAGSISAAAKKAGIDKRIMLALAKTENNKFNPLAPNAAGESSAFGLFQMLNDTFNEFGGGDRTDPNQQIANAMTFFQHLNEKHGEKGLDELIVRWHDGQNSKGEPSDEAKKFLARFKRNLDG